MEVYLLYNNKQLYKEKKTVLISCFKSVYLSAYKNFKAVEKILINSYIDNLFYNVLIQSDFGDG